MSNTIDYKNYGKEFAISYIRMRGAKVFSDNDLNSLNNRYILLITELLCLLTQNSRLSNLFIDKFTSFLINLEKEEERELIPYDYIAFFVYKHSVNFSLKRIEETFGDITSRITMLSTESQQYGEQIYKVSGKLKRHIQLAIYQKEFIEERLEKANQLANDIEKKAKKIDRQAENLLQNVYSSFIAILGIFSAIIIAVFGGITFVGTSLSKLNDPYSYLLFLSTGILSLLLIIYFLFTWINKLSNPSTSEDPWPNCFFIIVIIILLIVAGSTSYFKLKDPNRVHSTNQENKNISVTES